METRFAELLWELTGNAALHLVLSVFFQVGSLVRITTHPPVRDGNLRAQLARRDLARALLARDREAAIDAAMEHRRLVLTGLKLNDAAT